MASPDTTASSIIHEPASYLERLVFPELFRDNQPIEVELGAGDGSFILEWAALNPQCNFIAVERLLGRLRKIEKRGGRAGLANLRGIRLEIGYFTEYLLPAGSVTAFHLYFPDPWPKKKHRKNRLIQAPFVEVMHRALAPNGRVYLRTDDIDYFAQMREVFEGAPKFTPANTPPALAAVRTDFEREFNAAGIPTNHAAYEKTS